MFRRLLSLFLLGLILCFELRAQDIIVTRNSQIIRGVVTFVNNDVVKYEQSADGQSVEKALNTNEISVIRFKEPSKWKNLPDNLVIGTLDDLYGRLARADIPERDAQLQSLVKYYSGLLPAQKERVKQSMVGRLSEEYNANSDFVSLRVEELLSMLPKNEPGRDVLLRVAASAYKSHYDLNALYSIDAELTEYESLTKKQFPKTREAISSAIAFVEEVYHFDDQLTGLWISEERMGAYDSPKYALSIRKTNNDSLEICFLRGLETIVFDKYSVQNSNFAQLFSFNGSTKEYSFTFSSKRYSNGNVALAEGAVILGGAISSTIAKNNAMNNPYYNPGTNNSSAILVSALAAKLAEKSTSIDILKLFGRMVSPNVFESRLLVERTIVSSMNPDPDRTLMEDRTIKWLRIPLEEDAHLFDKQGWVFGAESSSWSWQDFKQQSTVFLESAEYRAYLESHPEMAGEKSFVKVRKAFNQHVYDRLNQR